MDKVFKQCLKKEFPINFQYFASIFENNPTPPNSLIYVVLPAELSRKSLQILIQYMYSGEATVSNDILNEVLRGGELLRIRGLWRSNHHGSDPQGPSQRPVEAAGATRVIKQDVSVIDKHLSEIGVKPPTNGALKESPVLVMHPHVATPTPYTPPIQNLAVKKDVAIDPGEGRPIPSSHYGLVSLQIAAAVKKAQQHSEKRTKSLSGEYHRIMNSRCFFIATTYIIFITSYVSIIIIL